MVAIAVTRTEFSAAALRAAAARSDDPRVTRRAWAMAMVLDAYPRATAAELSGMAGGRFATGCTGSTPRVWPAFRIVCGLAAQLCCRPTLLSVEEQKQVEAWIEAGPDLETAGVVRWRRIDLVQLCVRISSAIGCSTTTMRS